MSEQDYKSIEDQLVKSPILRVALVIAGSTFVAIGVVGIVVPGLPTTPFLLLAAACYARSSKRFYHWLLSNRMFGPAICQWRETRTIPRNSKRWAIWLTVLSFGVTIIFFAPYVWLRFVLAGMAAVLLYFIIKIPVRDEPKV